MTKEQAENAITSSALVVAALYGYRKLSETADDVVPGKKPPLPGADLLGFGNLPSWGTFAVGWGFTFLVLAVIADWQQDLAGYFALLIMLGALLANGVQVSEHVKAKLNRTTAPTLSEAQAEKSATPTTEVAYFNSGPQSQAIQTAGAKNSLNLSPTATSV